MSPACDRSETTKKKTKRPEIAYSSTTNFATQSNQDNRILATQDTEIHAHDANFLGPIMVAQGGFTPFRGAGAIKTGPGEAGPEAGA